MSFRLLCVTAHPDDECYAFGGALALAAQAGVESHVVCLTDGQAATYRGTSRSSEELGAMRRAEFKTSCEILGVTHYELLDYQDAQLEFAEFSPLASRLVERIRRIQPHVVMTFGGDGALNTHPDHTMVSAVTTAAFHWVASPKRFPALGPLWKAQRLYYVSSSYFLPDKPAPLPAPWTLTLDIRSVFQCKMDALRAHPSQLPLMERTQPLFAEHGHNEYYTLAATVDPQPARHSTDMFEGVTE